MRTLLSLALAFAVSAGVAFAQDTEKKKERPKKPAKTAEEIFKAKDKDGDGKVTFDEFKGKVSKPELLEKMEKRFKALDKDADGSLTLEEFKAPPKREKKPGAKKRGEKKPAAK